MKIQTNWKRAAWVAVAILCAGDTAHAESSTWTGATGVAWLTDTNWLLNIVPGSATETTNADVATFSDNFQATAAIDMSLTDGVYYLGALQRLSGSTGNRILRNGNGSNPGVLILNGATLDTIAGGAGTTNVIIHQATTAGTFSINNGTGGGDLGINLPAAADYKIVADSLSTIVVNSSISGLGGLTILRAPGETTQVQLFGNNSYAGDTIVDSARLRAGVTPNTPNANSNGIPNGPGKGNLILQGTLQSGPQFQPLFGITANETINGLSGDGFIDNDGNFPYTLTIGDNDATGAFAGTIYNSGGAAATGYLSIAKIGNGTLTLSGNNTYSGTTTVSGGTLLVNGTHAGFHSNPNKQFFTDDYTVTNGATLGGIGNIDGNVKVRNGGIISPGTDSGSSSVGTLTINELVNATLAGDYNGDDVVNAADFTLWRDTLGDTINLAANGNNTGASENLIDEADYVVWRGDFGGTKGGVLKIDIDQSNAAINDLLVVEGALDLTSLTVGFDVTGALTQSSYVFASYFSLVGTFASANTPVGYTVDYNFGFANQIALVSESLGSSAANSIPEPASLILLSLGLLGIAITGRFYAAKQCG